MVLAQVNGRTLPGTSMCTRWRRVHASGRQHGTWCLQAIEKYKIFCGLEYGARAAAAQHRVKAAATGRQPVIDGYDARLGESENTQRL